jgi:hypothetical protein
MQSFCKVFAVSEEKREGSVSTDILPAALPPHNRAQCTNKEIPHQITPFEGDAFFISHIKDISFTHIAFFQMWESRVFRSPAALSISFSNGFTLFSFRLPRCSRAIR